MTDRAATAVPDVMAVPDVIDVNVPAGGRVIVVSDAHLGPSPTAASTAAATEIARAVEGWVGPGVVVLAGDVFELLAGPNLDVEIVLGAHPRLKTTLQAFVEDPEHRIVCLAGSHDGRIAWEERSQAKLRSLLQAELALAVDLSVETGRGIRRVRVEHGHQLDPYGAFTDPRNPLDSPLEQHVVREIVPAMSGGGRSWLSGMEGLDDPITFPRFVASRATYRRVARHVRWLLVPFLLAVALRVPVVWSLAQRTGRAAGLSRWEHRAALLVLGVLADVVLVVGALFFGTRKAWAAAVDMGIGAGERGANDLPRAEARALATRGYAGFVTGHTHRPELAVLGHVFYANTGACTDVVAERRARLGLPPVYAAQRLLSWVEIEAGAELHVRLVRGATDVPGAMSRLERLAARPLESPTARPTVVAAFPRSLGGSAPGAPAPSWPPVVSPLLRLRRVRRTAAAAIALAGVVSLLSALTPPLRDRLHALEHVVPLAVPELATALVALTGIGLLLLARGIRRGQAHARQLAMALLIGSSALHLLKGVDLEESIAAVVVAVYLAAHRSSFQAGTDRTSARRGMLALVAGAAVAIVGATTVVETMHPHRPRPPLLTALHAVAARLVGLASVNLPGRVDDVLGPGLLAVGIGIVAAAGWLLFRPVVVRHSSPDDERTRARAIVERHGGDTLAYFALRSDKRYFFTGNSVVAYAVLGGVCLVSPDPIGPEEERDAVWRAFHAFADEQALPVAVMGAGEDWLPVYRASGMHDLYVGDEAVVDCTRFDVQGGQKKGLRQAVNRVAKQGYTISFHDPAALDPDLREALTAIMTRSRRGDVERGFSMTLGRVFEADDRGLLLAVAHGPDGTPRAFCQYVPAPAIDGYSLDLMRRADDDDAPNGVTDFVVVETIRHLREHGRRGLALNFATMRAVLAGESGDSITQRVERWLLQRMSDSMQIESLWYFNAKYDPEWRPRYAVYDSPENLLPAAMAVARAESFWELPIIGRFLVPSD